VSDQVQPSDQRPAQLLRDALRSRVARFTSGLTCVLGSLFGSESGGKSLIVGGLAFWSVVSRLGVWSTVRGPGSVGRWKFQTDVISAELPSLSDENRQQKKILETATNQLSAEFYVELNRSLALERSLKRR
jgi:hypothetical protein